MDQNHQKPPHKTGKKIAQESGEILKTNHFSLHLSIVKRKDSRQFCEKSSSRAGCKDGCQGFREGFRFCVLCAALCECVLFYSCSRLSSKLEMDNVVPSFFPPRMMVGKSDTICQDWEQVSRGDVRTEGFYFCKAGPFPGGTAALCCVDVTKSKTNSNAT